MEGRHAVDGEAPVDVHMGHVDQAVLINDPGGLLLGVPGPNGLIQPADDGDQLGHGLLQIAEGPLLQSLRQNRVVGVGADPGDDGAGLLKADSPQAQQADQLRNHHAGVGVVDLDHRVVRQVVEIAAPGRRLVQNILGGAADHEVLLIDP